MKQKYIYAAVAVVLACVFFLYWHHAKRAPRKYKIAKKSAAPADAVKKKSAPIAALSLPPVQKKFTNPKIAIVMDDFGYNYNDLDMLFGINLPLTLSILPDLRYSTEIATLASRRGYETILHLPLESHNKNVREEADTIRGGMKEGEIGRRLGKALASVPGIRGVSNHMGSKSTEDKELMAVIFKYLKTKGLYFFDSLTSQQSACREEASVVGIPCSSRDVFLDNSDDTAAIEKQVLALRRLAFRKGKAIAVCHDKKSTIMVLARMMPEMADDGVKFVKLSELVK
jgi:hypothetical protein